MFDEDWKKPVFRQDHWAEDEEAGEGRMDEALERLDDALEEAKTASEHVKDAFRNDDES